MMADKLKSAQKTQQRAMAEEFKAVIEERDQVTSKVYCDQILKLCQEDICNVNVNAL
jgi:hypothetical protein